jgi:uncharacterized membrane protein
VPVAHQPHWRDLIVQAKTALLAAAIGGLLIANAQAMGPDDKSEKCFGVAKAGKNDCAANGHGCAAQAKSDADKKEWISVPKGTCEKLVGGSTTPAK